MAAVREKIKLVSTGKTQAGKKTGTCYTTTRNKKGVNPKKLSLKKFDPKAFNEATGKCGMHVVFNEDKIK